MVNEIKLFEYGRIMVIETKDKEFCLYVDNVLVCVVDKIEELFKGNYYAS